MQFPNQWIHNRFNSYSDSGQKSFRHIGHNDAYEQDYRLYPGILQDSTDYQEGDPQHHRHKADDVNEVGNLYSNGGFCNGNRKRIKILFHSNGCCFCSSAVSTH